MTRRSCANLAVLGARIRTLDPELPAASAVAIRAGTIIAVGSDAEVRQTCDARTEIVDLGGAAVVPGLIDSHSHPFNGSLEAVGADLTGLRTLDEVRSALAAERRRCGDGEWVRGYALAYEAFAGTGIHGAAILDAVQGAPTYLQFFDFHTALATPAALALAGVDGPRTFADTAEVVCLDGRPTGELRESAAGLVERVIPEPSAAERLVLYRATLARMNEAGLTGACVMLGRPGLFDEIRELEARGDLKMRLWVPLHQPPGVTDDEVDEHLRLRDERGLRWRGGIAKFFIDGVVESGTSWLCEPDTRGGSTRPFWPTEARYAEIVARFARAGFQVATHAVGDRAVRAALDAYRNAGPPPTGRHRIEHIETLQDADVPRFAAEDVAASMQILHMENNSGDQTDPWSQTLGPERCARAFRARDLVDSGAILPLGSDWPVARYDPRRGMGWARLRRAPGDPGQLPYLAGQALTGLEALHGYTTAPSRVIGEAHLSGMVRAGYRGDLTAFAEDPVDLDADRLLELPVVLTVVDGEICHRA